MNIDDKYKELVKYVLDEGIEKDDRTGTGTLSIFGHQMKFKMEDSFPLLTLRKIHTPSLVHELLWFLESYDKKYSKFGNTNIKYLLDNDITFWTEWAYEEYKRETFKSYLENDLKKDRTTKKLKLLSKKDFEKRIKSDDEFSLKWGNLGPVYGKQWTDWGGYSEKVELKKEYGHTKANSKIVDHLGWENIKIDGVNQIDNVIKELKENSDSRRLIVNSWNVDEIEDMLLPPCHVMFQFYTFQKKGESKKRISLQLYQRSVDLGLGAPYNIASYSILLHMVAKLVDMIPHEFIYTMGDAHIYKNHIPQLEELLERESKPLTTKIEIGDINNIRDFRFNENLFINDYQYHPNIKMEVAV
jgi:thymidylate synthase